MACAKISVDFVSWMCLKSSEAVALDLIRLNLRAAFSIRGGTLFCSIMEESSGFILPWMMCLATVPVGR